MTDTTTAQAPGTRLLLQQALDQLNKNETDLAEATLLKILSGEADEPDALQLLGLVRKGQGRLDEAADLLRRSLKAKPAQPHVQNNLGSILYAQQNYKDAGAAFAEAVRLKSNYAEAYLNLALAQHADGDPAAAEKSARAALRYQPNYLMAAQTLGMVLNDLERAKEAEVILRNAIAAGSRNPRQAAALQHNLGMALKQQRRYDEALPLFDAAQSAVPDLQAVDYNRGNVLQQMGRTDEAVWSYRRALAANPLDIGAHSALNQLLYRLGRDDEFLKSFDEAVELYPQANVLRLGRGDFLLRTDRFEEAREAYGSAAAAEPENVFAYDGLALALTNLRDYDAAIAAHENSLRLNPRNPAAWSNLALTLIGAGEGTRAAKAAEEALARDPLHQAALANLGTAWRMMGDTRDEELNDYENMVRVFEIAPPDGYADVEAFNRDLNAYLDRLHRDKRESLDQTLRGGTQTLDNIFGTGHKPVDALRARIDEAVTQYIAGMKDKTDHPLFGRKARNFGYAASWSSRLHDCGFHTNHLHPKGWISSAYYVALPESVADEKSKEGWIKFGEPGIENPLKDAVRRTVQPKAGRLVLFPSYMWHGTNPFHSQNARTTIAFDVVPR